MKLTQLLCGLGLFLLFAPLALPKKQGAPAAKVEYVGSEMCSACHEEISNAFKKNAHFSVETNKKRGWEGKSCESCHGPGGKHAESTEAKDILNPKKLSSTKSDGTCLSCHVNQQTHVGRIDSAHARGQVGCLSCHGIHSGAAVARTSQAINTQCATCHRDAWQAFLRPHAHRLTQNAMNCVDCHNPHGSFRPAQAQMWGGTEPGCLKCHADKRGPFAFEHAPMRQDGCQGCHEVHGSANPRMLTRAEVRYVCLECHSNIGTTSTTRTIGGVPPAIHNLNSPRFRNCTTCHQRVHGSHVDRYLQR